MDQEPIVSKVIASSQDQIKRRFRESLESLPAYLVTEYEEGVTAARNTISGEGSFHRWILFYHFLLSGFLQARVMYDSDTVFAFGAEIFPWKVNRDNALDSEGEKRLDRRMLAENNLVYLDLYAEDRALPLSIEGVIPATLENIGRKVVMDEVIPFSLRYYPRLPFFINRKPLDLWEPLEKRMVEGIEKSLLHHESVVLTHILFMNMRPYFEHMGEFRSLEVLEAIENDIRKMLLPLESYFKFSPLSYVVLTPDADEKAIRKRFRGMVFYVESLVFDYQMFQTTIAGLPVKPNDIWKTIHI